ncbi:MAG: amino acid permease [Candidatus Babeliaceae bacterium]|jgi:amino acid transporter
MPATHRLSLFSAILINVNIMLGSGIFINTVLLSKAAGSLGALTYVIVGILMIPLISVIAELLKDHHGGTFYEFGKNIHPLLGFISSWGYFTAKLASAALGIHIFVTLIQKISPTLSIINPLIIDSVIILFFSFLNMLNVRTGRSIQYVFIILKALPILFVILTALFYGTLHNFSYQTFLWQGIPGTLPFVLFAFAGFEASCSLSRSIDNPEKNAPRAIFISFFIVLIAMIMYQISFFSILGSYLQELSSFREAFPAISQKIFSHIIWQKYANAVTLSGIATSSLGASYGILFSNSWNLFTLAQHGHTIAQNKLITLNKHHMPYICILIEALFALGYVWFFKGEQVPLQQISALGSTLAYTISVCAFTISAFYVYKNKRILACAGILTCLLLLLATARNALLFGIYAYALYSTIILIGLVMYFITASIRD